MSWGDAESRVGTELPATMSALRWHGPRDVRVDSVPVPEPGPGQVLVAVERVGLCGSDLEEYRSGPVAIPVAAVPLILGHEVVGTVVQTSDPSLPVGARVIPDVVVGCGHCWWCRRHEEGLCPDLLVRGQQQDGGLADYLLADAATCTPVPGGVSLNTAAFAEPAAVAVRALRKAGDLTGATVAVVGGGTVGNLVAQIALRAPTAAVVVVDPVEARRDLGARFGAATAAPGAQAAELVGLLTEGRGADVVLECAGVPSGPADALALSRRGGTIVLVGFRASDLTLSWLDVVLGERRLVGSAAHLWDIDVTAAVGLLTRGVLDPGGLLSATFALADAPAAFERLDSDPLVTKLLIAPGFDLTKGAGGAP